MSQATTAAGPGTRPRRGPDPAPAPRQPRFLPEHLDRGEEGGLFGVRWQSEARAPTPLWQERSDVAGAARTVPPRRSAPCQSAVAATLCQRTPKALSESARRTPAASPKTNAPVGSSDRRVNVLGFVPPPYSSFVGPTHTIHSLKKFMICTFVSWLALSAYFTLLLPGVCLSPARIIWSS